MEWPIRLVEETGFDGKTHGRDPIMRQISMVGEGIEPWARASHITSFKIRCDEHVLLRLLPRQISLDEIIELCVPPIGLFDGAVTNRFFNSGCSWS